MDTTDSQRRFARILGCLELAETTKPTAVANPKP